MANKKPKSNKGFAPRGSGGLLGGSRRQRRPKEVADTGHSGSYAEILFALGEGEIEGISLDNVFIDETPIYNVADSTFNFSGVNIEFRNGTQNQDRILGQSDITSETNVAAEVKQPIPITRQIINRNCDSIRVRVAVQLQEFPEKGGVLGSSIQFRIDIKEGSGPFVTRITETIRGRYSQLTEFEYNFPVNNMGGTVDIFQVRVTRITPESTDPQRLQQLLRFQSFTEVIETKLSYPNTALASIHIDAKQFSSSPQFSFLTFGKKILIPSNAVVNTTDRCLDYSGTWDGTFYMSPAAVRDPVWQLYDLMINERYGLGRYIKSGNINRYALYEISRYCNAMVSDGRGGFERRYACDVVLNGTEDAYRVVEAYRSIFRGYSYYANGVINFVADMPGTVAMQFTQADVEDGMFSYARTSLRSRSTVCLVTWIDPNDFYKRAVEVVEDPEGIARYGVRIREISAFGCTSQGQARRAGLSVIKTELLETETVTFRVRAFGAACTPGMIISIADARRAEIRYGGLIAGHGSNYIDVDAPVQFLPGESYTVSYMCTDGTLEYRTVNVPASTATRLVLTTAVSKTPTIEGNWILQTNLIQPQLFRVLNRSVVPGSEDSLYEITALEYVAEKYAAIEQGLTVTPRTTRITAPLITNVPRDVRAFFQVLQNGPRIEYVLTAAWLFPLNNGNRDEFIASYLVEYKKGDSEDWTGTTSTTNQFAEFPGLAEGIYRVRVAAVDLNGSASVWVESNDVNLGAITTDLSVNTPVQAMFIVEF